MDDDSTWDEITTAARRLNEQYSEAESCVHDFIGTRPDLGVTDGRRARS